MLLIASSLEAQSIADVARRERERQAKASATIVITSVESAKPEEAKPAAAAANGAPAAPGAAPGKAEESRAAEGKPSESKPADAAKDAAKLPTPPAPDPAQIWNNQLNQIRTKIRTLQDQEMALVLQLNQANNQVYAPVIDPATQQRALAQVGQIQQQLDTVRKDLLEARTSLDALQLQGPPASNSNNRPR